MDFYCICGILMELYGFYWILLEFRWNFTHSYGISTGFGVTLWILRDLTEFWCNLMSCYGVVRNSDETSRILIEFNGTLMELHALWWNPLGIWWNVMDFTKISGNCSATLWILMECYGIPKELHGFQWNFMEFIWIVTDSYGMSAGSDVVLWMFTEFYGILR